VVERVLSHSRGPVALEALVDALAEASGFPRRLSSRPTLSRAPRSSGRPAPARRCRVSAGALVEITLLPPRQRTALLLSLRLEDGESVTRVLAAFDIAPIRAVAKDARDAPLGAALDLERTSLFPTSESLSCSAPRAGR
jgi:hypothetical protein